MATIESQCLAAFVGSIMAWQMVVTPTIAVSSLLFPRRGRYQTVRMHRADWT